MIFDGVELPRLLMIEKAAEVLGLSSDEVLALVSRREIDSVRLNGIVHVITESIAERLDVKTEARHNQDRE